MPLILPANTLDSSYEIENSLRCNGTDSFLNFTLGTPTNQKKATFSAWGKFNGQRSGSHDNSFWSMGDDTAQAMNVVRTSGQPQIYLDDSDQKYLNFNNTFLRDSSAWYHFVVQLDTTQSTATNRMKWFINGTQLSNTIASHEEQPDQNYDIPGLASGQTMAISKRASSSHHYIDGYIAEMIYLDGSIAAPTEFGETDDNGVWIPKKPTGLTFGNNGAWLEFKQTGTSQNASGIGADTSGNDNHYAVTNLAAIDVTVDTPTNNFATLNPLSNSLQASYSEGNLDEACNDNFGVGATQAFANGKWYWEVKIKAGDNNLVGIANSDEQHRFTTTFGINNYSLTVYGVNGKIYREGSEVEDVSDTFGANDIVGVAVDMDSGTRTVQFYKNGSTFGSATTLPTNWGFTLPMIRKGGSSQTSSFNFGNPAFSISSGNADANGYGNFEYAVPTGYYALCTKNLAEYG